MGRPRRQRSTQISIHAPREGSDPSRTTWAYLRKSFLSTLPVRGATCPNSFCVTSCCQFLSTLPVRGATCTAAEVCPRRDGISIHAPREGSDLSNLDEFKSRYISIHAPREGSDKGGGLWVYVMFDFYPRSP